MLLIETIRGGLVLSYGTGLAQHKSRKQLKINAALALALLTSLIALGSWLLPI